MNNSVKSEILFHIIDNFDNVDEKQLFNTIKPTQDGYILRAYGQTLRFNEDGDLIG